MCIRDRYPAADQARCLGQRVGHRAGLARLGVGQPVAHPPGQHRRQGTGEGHGSGDVLVGRVHPGRVGQQHLVGVHSQGGAARVAVTGGQAVDVDLGVPHHQCLGVQQFGPAGGELRLGVPVDHHVQVARVVQRHDVALDRSQHHALPRRVVVPHDGGHTSGQGVVFQRTRCQGRRPQRPGVVEDQQVVRSAQPADRGVVHGWRRRAGPIGPQSADDHVVRLVIGEEPGCPGDRPPQRPESPHPRRRRDAHPVEPAQSVRHQAHPHSRSPP